MRVQLILPYSMPINVDGTFVYSGVYGSVNRKQSHDYKNIAVRFVPGPGLFFAHLSFV